MQNLNIKIQTFSPNFFEHIRIIVDNELKAGFRSITDGEARRSMFHMDFLKQIGGIEVKGTCASGISASDGFIPPRYTITGKLAHQPIQVDDFKFLNDQIKALVGKYGSENNYATAKVCIPSPAIAHFRGGRASIDIDIYPDLKDYFADLAQVYQKELAALYEAGARFVQLDDTTLPFLCDEKHRKVVEERNDDPMTLLRTYVFDHIEKAS